MRCDRAWTMAVTLEAVKKYRNKLTVPKAARNHLLCHAAWLSLTLSPFLRFRNIRPTIKSLSFGYLLANVCFVFSSWL